MAILVTGKNPTQCGTNCAAKSPPNREGLYYSISVPNRARPPAETDGPCWAWYKPFPLRNGLKKYNSNTARGVYTNNQNRQ